MDDFGKASDSVSQCLSEPHRYCQKAKPLLPRLQSQSEQLSITMLSKFKYIFMFCNTLIIGSSIFGFIWGNINYAEYWAVNGSFIGGQLATICVGLIIFGLLGLYASYKNNYQIICSYTVFVLMSLILRVITWLLAFFHNYRLKTWYYAYLAVETVLLILSFIVRKNTKKYHGNE